GDARADAPAVLGRRAAAGRAGGAARGAAALLRAGYLGDGPDAGATARPRGGAARAVLAPRSPGFEQLEGTARAVDRCREDVRALGARFRIVGPLAHRGELVQQLERVADMLRRRFRRRGPSGPGATITRAAPLGATASIHHAAPLPGDRRDSEPARIAPSISPHATIGKQTAAGHAPSVARVEVAGHRKGASRGLSRPARPPQ